MSGNDIYCIEWVDCTHHIFAQKLILLAPLTSIISYSTAYRKYANFLNYWNVGGVKKGFGYHMKKVLDSFCIVILSCFWKMYIVLELVIAFLG